MPNARLSDPWTSAKAAAYKSSAKLRRTCRIGVDQFARAHFHDQQLAEAVGDDRNIVARERLSLVELGFVERAMDGDHQLSTRGPRGRDVLLWQFTEGAVEGTIAWPTPKKRTHSQLSMDV